MNPLYKHPIDPPHLYDRARDLGLLLASGEMSRDSVRVVCHAMAQGADTSLDKAGLGTRLVWTATDTTAARAEAVWAAHDAIRRAVRPLMAARASKAEIEEAAGRAAGDVISWDAIFAILRDEVRRLQFKSRWRK